MVLDPNNEQTWASKIQIHWWGCTSLASRGWRPPFAKKTHGTCYPKMWERFASLTVGTTDQTFSLEVISLSKSLVSSSPFRTLFPKVYTFADMSGAFATHLRRNTRYVSCLGRITDWVLCRGSGTRRLPSAQELMEWEALKTDHWRSMLVEEKLQREASVWIATWLCCKSETRTNPKNLFKFEE